MNSLAQYVVFALQSLAALFVFYAFLFTVLRFIRTHYLQHHWLIRPAFILMAIAFVIADWWVNVVISFLLLDPPHAFNELVTTRMKRYKAKRLTIFSPWWQRYHYRVAVFICKQLNQYDKGHC